MPNTAVRVGEGAAVFCLGQVILVTLLILVTLVILVILVIIIVDKVSWHESCFMMIIFVMMQDSGTEEGVTVSKLFSALGLCRQVRSASASSLSS